MEIGDKMKNQVINTIENEKIIVIVRGIEKNKLLPLTEAMYNGGIRLLEVTYSADGKISDEQTAENIKMLAEHFNGKMYIGAGTVLTEKQVELTKNAGGTFIISPDTYSDVIRRTNELEMVSIPGALTPTDIQNAHRLGADFVKLFPVTSLGLPYIKAIKAPLSHIKFLAVGGIDENNIEEYLKAGVKGFGIGSNIVNKNIIENGEFNTITELCQKYTKVIEK